MPNSQVARVAQRVSLVFAGLFAGFLVAVLVLELSLRDLDGQAYTEVRLAELDSLDRLATGTLLPALLATALLAVFAYKADRRRPLLALTALALLVAVLALTLVVNLPINTDQLDWNVQSPPTDWMSVRDRWQLAHALRTGAAVAAFGVLIAAATRTPPGRPVASAG
ncbi:anthrone oxygenase family protein [Solicola gregarius]|uniref:DUF1772 domain-containing protein n=1 Tax=Solicola gregarius TaxID=2908642 RepID=A0AA46TJ39_9ACTN|nr:anthrone oxygenase family protein [Solicola gregarius]UYM05792.1 DUF1772 domain-containing protein [Solicola gregarius]